MSSDDFKLGRVNWPLVRIGDVSEVFDGPHATPKTVDSGPVFLGIGSLNNGRIELGETRHVTEDDFAKWTRRVEPRENDVVFSYETRIGEVAIIPAGLKCCLGRRMGLVRTSPDYLHPRFFLYYYLSPGFQELLRSRTISGATVDRIALKEFPSFPVALPPLPEQRAIASVLSALDDKIELNRRMNETLEGMARALFADWFVHFGPTRAKMEGTEPYLAPEIWSLFPDRLDENGLPEGWEMGTLADIAETNARSWTAKNHPNQIEYVDLSNTKWGVIEATAKLSWREAPSRARRIARIGDTIVATTRPGNGSYAYISRDGLTASTGFAVLSPKKEMFRDYLYIAATNPENIKRLANLADGHGGAYPAVKPGEVSDTRAVIPSVAVMQAFSSAVSPLREKIEFNKAESRTLAQTRDLLLPKLMSGEIRVREAENHMEDSV